MNKLLRLARLLSLSLLTLAALALIVISWNRGTANLYARQSEQVLAHFQQSGRSDPELAQQAMAAIEQALRLHPNHAHYHSLRGRLQHWAAYHEADQARAQSLLAAAQADYQQAVALRPHWPVTWIDLAQVHFERTGQQYDSEFWRLYQRAEQQGPYLDAVMLGQVTLLLRGWPQLSPSQQRHFYRTLSRMEGQPALSNQALTLAAQYQRLDEICPVLASHPELVRLHQRALQRRSCPAATG